MSSTNKTEKLNLSQFVATDKPAWLTDYNNDMQKIDAGIAGMQGSVSESVSSMQAELDDAVEASKENGIAVYAHTKSGTVHTLAGKGNNIKFKATADFVAGDTIEIGGISLEVKGTAAWKVGDTVMALLDDARIAFVGSENEGKWVKGEFKNPNASKFTTYMASYKYNAKLKMLIVEGDIRSGSANISPTDILLSVGEIPGISIPKSVQRLNGAMHTSPTLSSLSATNGELRTAGELVCVISNQQIIRFNFTICTDWD